MSWFGRWFGSLPPGADSHSGVAPLPIAVPIPVEHRDIPILDHVALALARLPQQYRGSDDVPTELLEGSPDVLPTTLSVALTGSADPVDSEGTFDYTVTLTNTGVFTARDIVVKITLDVALTFVSGSGSGWSVSESDGVVTATRTSAAPGAAPALTVTVSAPAGAGSVTSTVAAAARNVDTPATDSDDTSILAPTTTLTVSIADSDDPVGTETALAYTVAVENTGGVDAENVRAVITLDASLTYVSASGDGWTISESAGVVTATRAALAPGAAPDITINTTTGSTATIASTEVGLTASNADPVSNTEATTVENITWTIDGTSNIAIPQNAQEWLDCTGLSLAHLWLYQMASGNAEDAIGSHDLAVNGTVDYEQSATGWATTVAQLTQTLSERFRSDSGGPDVSSVSRMDILYVAFDGNPGSNRDVFGFGADPFLQVRENADRKIGLIVGGNTVAGSVVYDTGVMFPLVVVYDRTGEAVFVATNKETFAGTYGALAGARTAVGGYVGGTSAAFRILLHATVTGAEAEKSSAQAKAILQSLGWTVTGY